MTIKKISLLFFILFFCMVVPTYSATLSSVRADLKKAWGIDNDNRFPADSFYNWAINKGYELIGVPKMDTIVISRGTAIYSLNSDCKYIEGVELFSQRDTVVMLSIVQIGDLGSKFSEAARPTQVAQYGLNLKCHPIPVQTDTLLVYYNALPTALSNDTNTVLTSPELQPLLVPLAMEYMKKRTGEITTEQLIQFVMGLLQKEKKLDIVKQPEVVK